MNSRLRTSIPLALILIALAAVYALSATWGPEGQTRDAIGAALPGRSLAKTASLDVSEFSNYDGWLAQVDGSVFSNRAPGLIAISAFGYLITSPFTTDFVFWPATLMAVVTSVMAAVFIALTARRIFGTPFWLSAAAFGIGTSMWSIASDQLWPHGPASMFIALALLCLSKEQIWAAGAAFGAAILIRPPVAVAVAVIGIGLALHRKTIRPALKLGVPSAIAAALFFAYNKALFGSWSPVAIYDAADGLGGSSPSGLARIEYVTIALFSPRFGVLIWTPWIIVGLFALRRVAGAVPDWAKLLPIASLAYIVVHMQLNRVSGGLPYGYRYALEAVAVVAPVLIGAVWLQRGNRAMRVSTTIGVAIAVGLQVSYIFVAECTGIGTANPSCGLFGL